MYGGRYSQVYGYGAHGPEIDHRCPVCGNDRDECNPEAHAAEQRAEAAEYFEQAFEVALALEGGYTPDDAICFACGDVGVEWDTEIETSPGRWETLCRTCEARQADVHDEPDHDCLLPELCGQTDPFSAQAGFSGPEHTIWCNNSSGARGILCECGGVTPLADSPSACQWCGGRF